MVLRMTFVLLSPDNDFRGFSRDWKKSRMTQVGVEKPGDGIFRRALELARFWEPSLQRDEVLHIGDSLEADFCGARAFGFQAPPRKACSRPGCSRHLAEECLNLKKYIEVYRSLCE